MKSSKRSSARVLVAVLVASGAWACSLLVDEASYVGGTARVDAGIDGATDAAGEGDADAADGCASCEELSPNDLLLWLSADVGVELGADSEHVAVWRDRTPSLRPGRAELTVKQPVAGAQPKRVMTTSGMPAIEFDGSNAFFELGPGLAEVGRFGVSIFAAFAPEVDDGGFAGQIFAMGLASGQFPGCGRSAELTVMGNGISYRVEGSEVTGYGSLLPSAWDVASAIQFPWSTDAGPCGGDRSTVEVRVRGVSRATGSAESLHEAIHFGGFVGKSAYFGSLFHGRLGELIVYGRALGDQEMVRITEYLVRRWGPK